MDRKKIFLILAIVIVVFVFFNPFGSKQNMQAPITMPKVSKEQVTIVKDFIGKQHISPEDFIIKAFQTHDVIFLGDFWKIRQNLEFIMNLIPVLYANGIKQLAFEYALYDNQKEIDTLVTAKQYDQQQAYRILFNYLIIWGYQEYADVFKAAWQFNQTLSADQAPFRIVGLSVKQHYSSITKAADAEDPAVIRKVYANGIPEVFMADIIQKEFISQHKKVLVFGHMHTGFTRFKYVEFTEKMKKLGFTDLQKTGQIIYNAIGERVMNIFIHTALPSDKNYSGVFYPVQGAIDAAIEELSPNSWRTGFYTSDNPVGALLIDYKIYTKGYTTLHLSDFCDAYIILNRIREQTPVTPIPDFINESNIEEATENFVGMDNKKLTVKDFTKYINDDVDGIKKTMALFD